MRGTIIAKAHFVMRSHDNESFIARLPFGRGPINRDGERGGSMRGRSTTLLTLGFAALGGLQATVAQEAGEAAAPKYLVTWFERPNGSPEAYEAAQERVLQLFGGYEIPASLDVQQFLVRVGEYGGYMVVATDDLAALHEFTTTFAVFAFEVQPVLEVMDAVAAEVAAVEYRRSVDAAE